MSKLYPDFAMNPQLAGLSSDAVDLLCAIILAHPARDVFGDSDRAFIDATLALRAAGLLKIETDGEDFRFAIAPFGEAVQ